MTLLTMRGQPAHRRIQPSFGPPFLAAKDLAQQGLIYAYPYCQLGLRNLALIDCRHDDKRWIVFGHVALFVNYPSKDSVPTCEVIRIGIDPKVDSGDAPQGGQCPDFIQRDRKST